MKAKIGPDLQALLDSGRSLDDMVRRGQVLAYGTVTQITSTDAGQHECAHGNGWSVTVPFWIFTKRVFVCSDCGAVRPPL